MGSNTPPIEFAGIAFSGLQLADLFHDETRLVHVLTINAEYIVRANEDPRLRRIVSSGVATFDGQVPYVLARLMNRTRSFRKISGSDLIYDVCERAGLRGERVFLLGGSPDSNAKSVEVLGQVTGRLAISGFSPPHSPYPFGDEVRSDIADRIRSFRPHYLFVAFGAGKQDYWIDDHRELLRSCEVRFVSGIGGTLDMVSGNVRRAPVWMRRMGLEGFFRFAAEPKLFRFKRLLTSMKFLHYV